VAVSNGGPAAPRRVVVHATNSAWGERSAYGARSAHIAAQRPEDAAVVVCCRRKAAGVPLLAGVTVHPDALPLHYLGAAGLLALAGRKADRLMTEWRGFDAGTARRLAALAPGTVRVLHAWEWMPRSLAVLRSRHPGAIAIRDVTIAREFEYRSRVDIRDEDRGFDFFFSPSPWASERLRGWGVSEAKIREIPFGVDSDLFRPLADRPESPLRFAFSGAVSAKKGVPSLLRAWKQVAFADAELHLYGNVYADAAAELAGTPNVRPHGFVDLTTELAANHVFVFPSTLEGSSKSVYEALACGLPVITTPNAGSVVRDGADGIVVPADDDEALARALRRLHDDAGLRRAMGRSARERAEEYSWQRYGRAVWSAYGELTREA
jgi:glycosyltransferase involved in cell wall biosynthesis